jgi:hypothetical protein
VSPLFDLPFFGAPSSIFVTVCTSEGHGEAGGGVVTKNKTEHTQNHTQLTPDAGAPNAVQSTHGSPFFGSPMFYIIYIFFARRPSGQMRKAKREPGLHPRTRSEHDAALTHLGLFGDSTTLAHVAQYGPNTWIPPPEAVLAAAKQGACRSERAGRALSLPAGRVAMRNTGSHLGPKNKTVMENVESGVPEDDTAIEAAREHLRLAAVERGRGKNAHLRHRRAQQDKDAMAAAAEAGATCVAAHARSAAPSATGYTGMAAYLLSRLGDVARGEDVPDFLFDGASGPRAQLPSMRRLNKDAPDPQPQPPQTTAETKEERNERKKKRKRMRSHEKSKCKKVQAMIIQGRHHQDPKRAN